MHAPPCHSFPPHITARLLRLFGVPYIEAPEEAEAQCAQLEQAGLVDGVVTEDNDALLFGARAVYRHLFDPQHHVEVRCCTFRSLPTADCFWLFQPC